MPVCLAKRLLNLATVYGERDGPGVRIGLKLPQTELGHMMGTSRESINRHLQNWAKNGWIQIGRSQITLLDRQALQELVDHVFC